MRTGEQLDCNGQPAGYVESPEEVITHVDAHDNETLFDSLTLKLPQSTSMADRVRMNTLSLATAALAQTPSFWHAGADLLRSKSLDRHSDNSGDWFNVLDWSKQTNGFGRGLPPASDNQDKWPFQQPLLADPALGPTTADVGQATAVAQDLLRLRFSTKLLRLGSAELIEQKVSFSGRGPDALPGVVVMQVDDTVGRDVDTGLDGVLVVLDASPETVTVPVDGLAGGELPALARPGAGRRSRRQGGVMDVVVEDRERPRPDGRRVRRRPAARQARQAGEAWWAPRAVVGQGPDRPLSGGAGVTWDTPTPLCVRGANPIWAIAGMFGRQDSQDTVR